MSNPFKDLSPKVTPWTLSDDLSIDELKLVSTTWNQIIIRKQAEVKILEECLEAEDYSRRFKKTIDKTIARINAEIKKHELYKEMVDNEIGYRTGELIRPC